jgi:hypothetical protein
MGRGATSDDSYSYYPDLIEADSDDDNRATGR